MATSTLTSISSKIKTDVTINRYMVMKWNLTIPAIANKYTTGVTTLTPVQAAKYRFDFEGLLRNEFGIEKEYVYPYMLANGYKSSTDFNGNILDIRFLDKSILHKYYLLFKKGESSSTSV